MIGMLPLMYFMIKLDEYKLREDEVKMEFQGKSN